MATTISAANPERDIDHEIRMKTDPIYVATMEALVADVGPMLEKLDQPLHRIKARRGKRVTKEMLFALDFAAAVFRSFPGSQHTHRWKDIAAIKALLTGEDFDPSLGTTYPEVRDGQTN